MVKHSLILCFVRYPTSLNQPILELAPCTDSRNKTRVPIYLVTITVASWDGPTALVLLNISLSKYNCMFLYVYMGVTIVYNYVIIIITRNVES